MAFGAVVVVLKDPRQSAEGAPTKDEAHDSHLHHAAAVTASASAAVTTAESATIGVSPAASISTTIASAAASVTVVVVIVVRSVPAVPKYVTKFQ